MAPVLLCTLGGALVGVATSHTGFSLDTLGVVVGRCRTEGGYRVKNWPWALVLFALPEVLFSGQSGTWDLLSGWQAMGAGMLPATCVAKLALTQLYEESGWIGGEFFPLIFCGVAAGYAVAIITGGDPMLAVALSTGALVGLPPETGCSPPACLPSAFRQ